MNSPSSFHNLSLKIYKMCEYYQFNRDAPVRMVGQRPHIVLGENDEVSGFIKDFYYSVNVLLEYFDGIYYHLPHYIVLARVLYFFLFFPPVYGIACARLCMLTHTHMHEKVL